MKDNLYQLAFEYRKTKLWEKLWDTDLFALRLKDGRLGYVSIMGKAGEHNAVALYIEEAFQTFLTLINSDESSLSSPFDQLELLLSQECLQLSFEDRRDMEPWEWEELREYKENHGVDVRGKFTNPTFKTFVPRQVPAPITDEKELNDLKETLEVVLYVARLRKKELSVFFKDVPGPHHQIPLLERSKEGYDITTLALPKHKELSYPSAEAVNIFTLERLNKEKRRSADMECNLVMLPNAFMREDGALIYPYAFLSVDRQSQYAFEPLISEDYPADPEKLINKWIDVLLDKKTRPLKLFVKNERTFKLLEPLAKIGGFKLQMGKTRALDDFEWDFYDQMKVGSGVSEDLDSIIDLIMYGPLEALEDIPEEILTDIEHVISLVDLDRKTFNEIKNKIQLTRILRKK